MTVYLLVHHQTGKLALCTYSITGYRIIEGVDEAGSYTLIDSWEEHG